MLVLSRRAGQSIETDGPAKFTLLGRDGLLFKVGVEADPSVTILRSELVEERGAGSRERPLPTESILPPCSELCEAAA